MSEFFLKTVNLSISAGWLVLAVLVLRVFLKKAPRWSHVLLWGIVALRLICPVSIESVLSLVPSAETIPLDIGLDTTPAIHSGVNVINSAVNPILSQSNTPMPGASVNPLQITIAIYANIWVLGSLAMLIYTGASYLSLKRRLRTAVILRSNIYQCENVASPFVLGIFRPKIYLPYALDGQDLHHVVAHEQAHIRRKDHWWKPLGFLLLTIHWFNPLVWLAYILLCRDIELACDEKVIRSLGNDQRADYTQALVACSIGRRRIAACPLAFGEVGVKQRVKSILNYRKPALWIIVITLMICTVVAICFLTDPNPSREFPMKGQNVSDLDPEAIVERILDVEDWKSSNIYVNSNNFSMMIDSDFNWVDSQAVRYFFSNAHTTYSAQIRIFPDERKLFLTEPSEWVEQDQIYLLRHYLEAIKYLPQDEIRRIAPADHYIILLVDGGSPSDYNRVITYTSEGVQALDGWYLHLQIHPLHEDGEGYRGTGEEIIDLFFGERNVVHSDSVEKWFDYTNNHSLMSYEKELTIQLEEFSDTVFKYTPYGITATSKENSNSAGDTVLISGMPIWNAYFCDLTGDGLPEICSQVSYGSGMIDNHVVIFDYANGISYQLWDRGYHDYYLRVEDGCLYVDKRLYNSDQLISSGRLVFENGSIQIAGVSNDAASLLLAEILEIHDGYFLVEPVEGSWELNSASRIEVPMKYMSPSPEPQVGDVLQIEYNGEILETYPARLGEVYHIALQRTNTQVMTLIPTDTHLEGMYAGALLLPMDGNIYRYQLTEGNPEGLTADELLFTFTEETHIEGIVWEVYSIKEYPDRSAVLIISGTNSSWLCTYDPPDRCADSALADAINAEYVVMEDGLATHGQDIWQEFFWQTRQGSAASVTVAWYGTLDEQRCTDEYAEVFRQDYPQLQLYELKFDGKEYTLTFQSGGSLHTRTYEYLMVYGAANFPTSYIVPEGRREYVLTHDDTITWEQLWNGLYSAHSSDYIDHFAIYSENEP